MARKTRSEARRKRHERVRKNMIGTSERPRLNVFRSLNQIYAQVIDDNQGSTLVSASSLEKQLTQELSGKKKTEKAYRIGQVLAERAVAAGIKLVVFDRGGYRFSGRVKALADGARAGGLDF